MTGPSSLPPLSTFVVRFWREWPADEHPWRGRVEHVQSGESTMFLSWQQLIGFVQRFGIMTKSP